MMRTKIRRMFGFLLVALPAAGALGATATIGTITNVDYWVQELRVSLSGSTPGVFITNGIIAHTHAVPVKIAPRDIINSLNNQPVFTIRKDSIQVAVSVTTNKVPNAADIVTTNYMDVAFPAYGEQVTLSFSTQAKLMLLQPLGLASQVAAPFVAIRDGNPAVDYRVDQYFTLDNIRTNTPETDPKAPITGKLDVLHDLVSVTRYADTGYGFASPGSSATSVNLQVGGYATERVQSTIIHQTNVVDRATVTSLNASVVGTGSIGASNAFCVLRGTVSAQGGKLETKY